MADAAVSGARSGAEAFKDSLITPTGRQVVVQLARGHGLYKIGYSDGDGPIPEQYSGRYTKPDLAREDAEKMVAEMELAYREWLKEQEQPEAKLEQKIEDIKRRGRSRKQDEVSQ